MDQQNFPIWEDLMTEWVAEKYSTHFGSKEVYNAYNSWYLRAGIPNSQEIFFDAFDLSTFQKLVLFFRFKK